jgi:hypothetical protein
VINAVHNYLYSMHQLLRPAEATPILPDLTYSTCRTSISFRKWMFYRMFSRASPSAYLSARVFQFYTCYWFSVAFRHECQFTASLGVRLLHHSYSHVSFLFISGLPLLFYPSGDKFNFRVGHLLSPVCNMCP